MHVVMNGLAALKPKTGVGHYVAQLYQHMVQAAPDEHITLYPPDGIARLIRRAQSVEKAVPKSSPAGVTTPRQRVMQSGLTLAKHSARIAANIHFARGCQTQGVQLYHEPNFVPFSCDLPTIITIHDLSVLLHPEWHPEDRVRHHERHLGPAVSRARQIIVVSEQVRQEVLAAFGLPPQRVTAIHNGVAETFYPMDDTQLTAERTRLGLPDQFFLCIGTIEPRKNIQTVLEAYVALPEVIRKRVPLILAGPWGWKSSREREYFLHTAQPAGARHLGYVHDADLPVLYNAATALMYPSFYEGFGLPPAEMLACGGQVVYSRNARAVVEIMRGHGIALPAEDVAAWHDTLRDLANAPRRRHPVSTAPTYRWQQAAEQTLAVYRQVLGLPGERSESPLPLAHAA